MNDMYEYVHRKRLRVPGGGDPDLDPGEGDPDLDPGGGDPDLDPSLEKVSAYGSNLTKFTQNFYII